LYLDAETSSALQLRDKYIKKQMGYQGRVKGESILF